MPRMEQVEICWIADCKLLAKYPFCVSGNFVRKVSVVYLGLADQLDVGECSPNGSGRSAESSVSVCEAPINLD